MNITSNKEKLVITYQDILLSHVPEKTVLKDKIVTFRACNTKGSGRIYKHETIAFISKWLNRIAF